MEFLLDGSSIRITKDYLLERNSQETYLSHYLGIPIKKGLFRSPLRKDTYPTCSFYKGKSGDILLHDFGTGEFLDFIQVVMKKYYTTYSKALNIIANDFGYKQVKGLIRSYKPIIKAEDFKESSQCKIQVELKEFSKEELAWWNKYGIGLETLRKFNVFSLKTVFLNGEVFTVTTPRSPTFGYYRGRNEDGLELWKIYYPYRKKMRFITNCNKNMLQCSQQLPRDGDYLVITKSTKDCLVLYQFGIPGIAPQSETNFLSEKQYRILMNRFKYIVVLYDNDLPGISNMRKFRKQFEKLGIKIYCIWIPRSYECKDISDFYKKYGKDETRELINKGKLWIEERWEQPLEEEETLMNYI